VPIVLKSGSLNLLEISGPVKACNGIALPYLVHATAASYNVSSTNHRNILHFMSKLREHVWAMFFNLRFKRIFGLKREKEDVDVENYSHISLDIIRVIP
jgi:hypothetical protein